MEEYYPWYKRQNLEVCIQFLTIIFPVTCHNLFVNIYFPCYYSLYADPIKVAKLQSCDFALFASAWWPRAPREELRILAYLAFWLFIWDDEIDESTGALSDNFAASEKYRLDTMDYVAQTLGIRNGSGIHSNRNGSVPLNAIIRSFDVIGEALSHAYNIGIPWLCWTLWLS